MINSSNCLINANVSTTDIAIHTEATYETTVSISIIIIVISIYIFHSTELTASKHYICLLYTSDAADE